MSFIVMAVSTGDRPTGTDQSAIGWRALAAMTQWRDLARAALWALWGGHAGPQGDSFLVRAGPA